MSEYVSDFQAPNYTVADKTADSDKIVTTVILGGEVVEFVTTRSLALAASRLADDRREQV